MEMTIELEDQDYQYCLDYASGKTNTMALNNTNRIIKAVADGTRYENQLKADMVANYKDIQAEIRRFMYDVNPNSSESDYACNYMIDIIQQKINALKGEEDYGSNN